MVSQTLQSKNINEIFSDIKGLEDFRPCPEVNELFSSLVNRIVEGRVEGDLSRGEVRKLRQLCGKSEFQLEKYWSNRIIESERPEEEIKKFPYFKNYEKLVAFEYATLVGCCSDLEKNAVFVGGGPLPFTAIMLAKDYGFNVTVIDRDKKAVSQAKKLFDALDLDINVVKSSAENFSDYNDFNVIHVAAMVGQSKSQELKVFNTIRRQMDEHSHLVARTVHGERKLLYRPVSREVKNMFNVEAEKRPSRDVVNSTVVMTVSDS